MIMIMIMIMMIWPRRCDELSGRSEKGGSPKFSRGAARDSMSKEAHCCNCLKAPPPLPPRADVAGFRTFEYP